MLVCIINERENAYCCSNSNEVIDFDEGGLGGLPEGGAGALLFLLDLGGPVNVLMAGDVGLSPGVTQPDSELTLLSPALWKESFKRCYYLVSRNLYNFSVLLQILTNISTLIHPGFFENNFYVTETLFFPAVVLKISIHILEIV